MSDKLVPNGLSRGCRVFCPANSALHGSARARAHVPDRTGLRVMSDYGTTACGEADFRPDDEVRKAPTPKPAPHRDSRSAGSASSSLRFPRPVLSSRIGAAFSSSRHLSRSRRVSRLSLKSGNRNSRESRISRLVKSARPSSATQEICERLRIAL